MGHDEPHLPSHLFSTCCLCIASSFSSLWSVSSSCETGCTHGAGRTSPPTLLLVLTCLPTAHPQGQQRGR